MIPNLGDDDGNAKYYKRNSNCEKIPVIFPSAECPAIGANENSADLEIQRAG